MTEKIYEYKTSDNWFLAKWGPLAYLTSFEGDQSYERASAVYHRLVEVLQVEGLHVHLAALSDLYFLVRFVVDQVNDRYQRKIQVSQRQGALLVIEDGQILLVELPAQGLAVDDLLGEGDGDGLADTILIATKNQGKTKEFRNFFEKLGYQVENLHQYPDLEDVAETGLTFEENARLKAETIAKATGKMVLADDSGLKVDCLGGLPGVWSARFSGPDATDASNNAKLLHELAMVLDKKDRSAQFHCTLVMAVPDGESLVVEADWEGYIANQPQGENGFGYDPLFLVGETNQTSAELSMEEKNKISHRAKALEQLMEVFPKWQANRYKS